MKLLSGLALLCYFNTASAACSDNNRRNHCLANSDCGWIREHGASGGSNGTCKDKEDISCSELNNNKKACNALAVGCRFNKISKTCVDETTPNLCSDYPKARHCRNVSGCWWNRGQQQCQGVSSKDVCGNFYYWRWGCHKKNTAADGCVYSTADGTCKDPANATCDAYEDNRHRCREDSKCEWKNNQCQEPTSSGSPDGYSCSQDSDCSSNNCGSSSPWATYNTCLA